MPSTDKPTKTFERLITFVEQAGQLAAEQQHTMDYWDRAYKADQSVVTEADRRVEDFLVERIARLDPTANIVTEEAERPFDPRKSPTFAVDPIDGTDVYSQGMPGWCVSVGMLDADLSPVAGVIYAPRLDLVLAAQGKGFASLNDTVLPLPALPDPISPRSNLMVTSRIHRTLDLRGYVGKIRGIGSAALHLCYPLIYPAVIGALEGPGIHIWDMAAAHAINRALGQNIRYLSGLAIDYAPLIHGSGAEDVVVAGQEATFRELRRMLRRLPDRSA